LIEKKKLKNLFQKNIGIFMQNFLMKKQIKSLKQNFMEKQVKSKKYILRKKLIKYYLQ